MVGLIVHGPKRVHLVRSATTHSFHERRTMTAMIYGVHYAILCIGIRYCTMPTTMVGFIVLSSHIAIHCKYLAYICVPVIHNWVTRCFHLDIGQSVVHHCVSVTWHSRLLLEVALLLSISISCWQYTSVIEDCYPLWRMCVSSFGLKSVIGSPCPFVRTPARCWESQHVIQHPDPLLEHRSPVAMLSHFLGVYFKSVVCRALFISCGNQSLTSISMPQLGTVQDTYCGIFILCSGSCIFMSWLHHKTP